MCKCLTKLVYSIISASHVYYIVQKIFSGRKLLYTLYFTKIKGMKEFVPQKILYIVHLHNSLQT